MLQRTRSNMSAQLHFGAEVLSQQLKPSMSLWMTDCFEVAAACRFEALSIACNRAVTGTTGQRASRKG